MQQAIEQREQVLDTSKRVTLSKILVTTDFSEVSNRALDYAIALARRYDARIYLAHVITPDPFQFAEPQLAQATYEKVQQAAEEEITDILISGKLRGVPHEVLLEEGNIWPSLEQMIARHDIDLVVAGTHGRGRVQKMLMGSVAEEIFRRADVAVLTVGPAVKDSVGSEVEFHRMLFATDFGFGAAKAAAYAFSLAQEHNARLTVLHVIENGEAYTEAGAARRSQVNILRMKRLMSRDCENWCKPEFRVTFGSAGEEILKVAHECQADLIVMGTKTSSRAGHIPATIAYNVVTKANSPVLTVRG